MTVHWLNEKTRERERGVLACMRLKGRHTYDVLAQAIEKVHVEFGIEKKVTMTTTDNARNFVKAFIQFGEERDLFPSTSVEPFIQDDTMDEAQSDTDLFQQLVSVEVDADERVEFVSVDDIAEMEELGVGYGTTQLAGHMKCGAHTWNLIACKDSEAALENYNFKRAYRAALAKAKALWNHQNQSTVTADALYKELNKRLIVPNDTRWNSLFDAIVCLNKVLEEHKDGLRRVMIQQGLTTFHDQDIHFFTEYIQVMQPVAKVIDIIQGDRNAYLGWLLPLCVTTAIRLNAVKNKQLHYCGPLVDALLAGIKKRFDAIFDKDECLLAAGFHPRLDILKFSHLYTKM